MTKYTEDKVLQITTLLKAGATIKMACKIAGISRQTFYNWMRKHRDFELKVNQAIVESEMMALNLILSHAERDWKAAAWFLERRFPDEWGKTTRIETETEGGSKIIVRFASISKSAESSEDTTEEPVSLLTEPE